MLYRPIKLSTTPIRLLATCRQFSTNSNVEQAIAEWTGRLNSYKHVEKDIVAENIISAAQVTIDPPEVTSTLAKG